MKGCLAVVGGIVVVGLILMIGFCSYVVKKSIDVSKELEASFKQLETTNKDFPFTKPPTSKLDAAKLDQVIAIRSRVAQGASDTLKSFQDLENGGRPDVGEMIDTFKDAIEKMKHIPIELETELRAIRMSFDEYVWTLDTAYGTIFKAADKGNTAAAELAKSIHGQIVDTKALGPKSEETFNTFRNRTMAIVDLDPATLDLVMARKGALTGEKASLLFDFFMSGRGRNLRPGA